MKHLRDLLVGADNTKTRFALHGEVWHQSRYDTFNVALSYEGTVYWFHLKRKDVSRYMGEKKELVEERLACQLKEITNSGEVRDLVRMAVLL